VDRIKHIAAGSEFTTAQTQTDESYGVTKFVKDKLSKRLAFLEITRMKDERNYMDTHDVNKSKKETFKGDLKALEDQENIQSDDEQMFSLNTNGSSSF